MHARVSFGRKSRIRPEGRCLVLRTHELGFVGERELAKVRERAQLVGGHARFTPLPGVKAVARKKEAKQLPELFRLHIAQFFPRRVLHALLFEGHHGVFRFSRSSRSSKRHV